MNFYYYKHIKFDLSTEIKDKKAERIVTDTLRKRFMSTCSMTREFYCFFAVAALITNNVAIVSNIPSGKTM